MNACRQEDSVTLFLFSSRTLVGKHGGDDFLQGQSLCLPSGSNTFHVLSWSGNNTRELCCIWRSRHLYSQPNCSLFCALTARSTTVTCFALLPLPFIHLLQTRSLTLARPHTPHSPPYSWKELRHSCNNRQVYFSCFWSNVAGPYGEAMIHQSNQSICIKPQHCRQCG